MFTGIVTHTGELQSIEHRNGDLRMTFILNGAALAGAREGDSMCVSGVCLTMLDLDGVIALGAVIRGGTPHFDYVAGECSRGLANVTLKYGLPVAFGVLTTDTIDQAIERASTDQGNKGYDVDMTFLNMVGLLRKLDKDRPPNA